MGRLPARKSCWLNCQYSLARRIVLARELLGTQGGFLAVVFAAQEAEEKTVLEKKFPLPMSAL
jgi:hypothetical protein